MKIPENFLLLMDNLISSGYFESRGEIFRCAMYFGQEVLKLEENIHHEQPISPLWAKDSPRMVVFSFRLPPYSLELIDKYINEKICYSRTEFITWIVVRYIEFLSINGLIQVKFRSDEVLWEYDQIVLDEWRKQALLQQLIIYYHGMIPKIILFKVLGFQEEELLIKWLYTTILHLGYIITIFDSFVQFDTIHAQKHPKSSLQTSNKPVSVRCMAHGQYIALENAIEMEWLFCEICEGFLCFSCFAQFFENNAYTCPSSDPIHFHFFKPTHPPLELLLKMSLK